MLKFISQNFPDPHYWFTFNPVTWSRNWLIGLLVVGCLLLVGAIVSGAVASRLKKAGDHLTAQAWRRGKNLGLTAGVAWLLLVWLRLEHITLLSSRWWWVIFAAWLIWRAVSLTLFVSKKLPRDKAALAKKMVFEKYLP